MTIDPATNAKTTLAVAERIVQVARRSCEVLTAEGWDLAYAQAITEGRIHLARRIESAKKLGLYRGEDR